MYVESLKISGFTSFRDVVWKPERLNVLIGPNGSGKSNLLRALELIRASAAGNLRDFVFSKGGLPRLLWGGLAQQMEFEIATGITPDQPPAEQPFSTGASVCKFPGGIGDSGRGDSSAGR
jgi:predicted ATPase